MIRFLSHLFSSTKNGYYFIHIPKTAGTSFINILDRLESTAQIFPCQLWREVNPEIVANKSQYKLFRGHFGGGAYKLLCENKPHLLTILRHPQSLSVSTYHFIKREKNTAVHDLVKSRNLSLLEFLQEPLTAQKINNRMVRHLSFDLHSDPEAQELFLSRQSVEVVSNWIKTPKKITNLQRLERAKKIIHKCSWFGIQEQFDKSMQLFAFTFNLPPIGKTAKLNVHNPNHDIDNTCKSLINEQNTFDLELYKFALKKFEVSYQQMCQQLTEKFNCPCTDENIDELLDKNYQSNQKSEILREINYGFEQKLIGSGWHRREITLPEGSTFRWTAHESAFIDFQLEPQVYDLSIRFINAITIEHLQDLELLINQQKQDIQYDTTNGVVRILSCRIDKALIVNNLLRIQLIQPKLIKHSESFASDDTRSLGLAVNWIKITPCKKSQH